MPFHVQTKRESTKISRPPSPAPSPPPSPYPSPHTHAHRLAMTAAAALVYPLHRLIALLPDGPSSPPSPPPSPPPPLGHLRLRLLSALAVLSTAGVPPWALAMWGAGHRDWGLASGLGVGLLAACLSLKSASFAQQCWRCRHSSFSSSSFSSSGGSSPPPPRASHPSARERKRERAGGQKGREEREERGRGRQGVPLTCGEFLFFLLAAPTLVGARIEN